MSVAPDLRSLKGRLDRFVRGNSSTEAVLLRRLLDEHFGRFDRVGIIGGLVRDFARGGRQAFKSDLDLVVEGDRKEVARLAQAVGARGNRFGGYGFTAGPWKIDFWALEDTWAVAQGHVAVRGLDDVVRCTFFDWDAIVYDLRTWRLICDPAYLERLRSRRLDISLRSNPGELGNLLRAARRIVSWNLQPGPALRLFIEEQLDESAFQSIVASERRKYPGRVLDRFAGAEQLRTYLLSPRSATTERARQMVLPLERLSQRDSRLLVVGQPRSRARMSDV